jgi:hypothetical protein
LCIVDDRRRDEWLIVAVKCNLGSSDFDTSLDELIGQEGLDPDVVVFLSLEMSKICELVR